MVRACRPPAREPMRFWLARRSTTATSTPANANSPASISPIGPPPATTTAWSAKYHPFLDPGLDSLESITGRPRIHLPSGSTDCLPWWSRGDSASQVLWLVRCLPRRLDPPRRPGLGERADSRCRRSGIIRRRHPVGDDLERSRRRPVGGNISGDLGVALRRRRTLTPIWFQEVGQEAVIAE